MTAPRQPTDPDRQTASHLRQHRSRIAATMAGAFASWPKFADDYRADPLTFAERECGALVDYVERWLATGDETYRDLYIGERVKQFYDPLVATDERRARERAMLTAARDAFLEGLNGDAATTLGAALDQINRILLADAVKDVRVLFVGDCLYLDVIAFLVAPLLSDGVRLIPFFVTSHDPAEQRASLAALADDPFDLIFYSPFTYSFDQRYGDLERWRALSSGQQTRVGIDAAARHMDDIIDVIGDLFECPIFVHTAGGVMRHDGTARGRAKLWMLRRARSRAASLLSESVRAAAARRTANGDRVFVVDEEHIVADTGVVAAGRWLYQADLQHPAEFGRLVARYYRDIIVAAATLVGRKLVMCDLDNTLWDGVIGEGLGITHYSDRQRVLLALKSRGVVLAINSKNDPARIHWDGPGALLSAGDFVSTQINWDPKPLNVGRIAGHLNLKPKDFVFVDDRADERSMVSDRFAGLLTLDALEPRSWALLQRWADLLPTKPGADRTDFYRQRDERQAYLAAEANQASVERDALYADLGLTLTIREAVAADLDRVADLINRTNQFNMTGARVAARQVDQLYASTDARILVADAADRFGSMGTICIIVLIRDGDGGTVTIPYFVLSCRVFGYSMEFAVLEHARRTAAGVPLAGEWKQTPMNDPCRTVYARAGFAEDSGRWIRAAVDDPLELPAWLTVKADARPLDAAIASGVSASCS